MAAPELSAVVALCNKASDLQHAGHRARSEEYTTRALAAAQALGAEDCLIVASLQLHLTQSSFNAAANHLEQRAPGTPPTARALLYFFGAAATLQRRRAAGTLLAGRCRAAELTWHQLTAEHVAQVTNDDNLRAKSGLALLFGYSLFLTAAAFASLVIRMADNGLTPPTQEQLRECVVLMADAAELTMQPRICKDTASYAEGIFADLMPKLMKHPELILAHGADGARLLDSWRRLEQSGVLERRDAKFAFQVSKQQSDSVISAAAAAAAAPGLRTCALASCGAREAHPAHFKSCAACRGVAYCCKEHQTADWPNHKAACKAARKAAAEAQQTD